MTRLTYQLLIFLLAVILPAVQPASAAMDATLQPMAKGSDVVRATIRKIRNACIFPDDFGLLHRIALVESNFGHDPNTFRPGTEAGGKGIWQINSTGFADTKYVRRDILDQVKERLNIDWMIMTFNSASMSVPLYNALAARLLLYWRIQTIPPGVEAQASIWKTFYNQDSAGSAAGFISKVNSRNSNTCDSVGADLLFILDESGSIGSSDFELMKNVVIAVANKLNVGPGASQIAVLTFSSQVNQRIDFGVHSTLDNLTAAIRRLQYVSGGTSTDEALSFVGSMFQNARPLDRGFSRVVVVLTDGQSNSPVLTETAAKNLNAFSWLERYAVGMGSSTSQPELRVIASACSRVYLISSTSDISALTDDLYGLACQSSASMPLPGVGSGGYSTLSGMLAPEKRRNLRDKAVSRDSGRTYGLKVTSGSATMYVSLSLENPNSAINDYSANAKPQSPGVIFVSSEDLTGGVGRTKHGIFANASTSSELYLSIVPDAQSGSVMYQLEAYDGDRRTFYPNSAAGNKGIFPWARLAAIVSIVTPLVTFG